ncbi:MAG: GTP-binding protein [Candidatus Lokiarchaeota archaeon]|nr:GTP-binding protein [Candidatus Lokiarchaeota archaeon]
MLYNIFLLKGTNLSDLDLLNIYSYPSNIIQIKNKEFIHQILYTHNDYRNNHKKKQIVRATQSGNKIYSYVIEEPVPQLITGLNIYTIYIDGTMSIGLIFEKDDNPYDYKDIFLDLLHEYLNIETNFSLDDDVEIENLLISLFIGIRRHGDEVINKKPQLEYHYENEFTKVFLFGIDEVGKTSLVHRIKTGDFNDNFFTPTRKFNIEYIQEDESLIAYWDMPGQILFRKKWLFGMQDSNFLIYMIDIANQLRFEEAKKEFWRILKRFEIIGVPILIIGNKVDLINENIDEQQIETLRKEIYKFFELEKITNRDWKFLFTSVKMDYNIDKITENIFQLISSNKIN